jgi:DNA-binding NarL/FixJ family response regulator
MKHSPPLKIMVVDDHPAFRMGLKKLVQSNPRLHVVAECGDGREAVALYRQIRPDVVLMDLRLPGLGGAEATMAIRAEFPDARVIVLTTFDADEDIYRAMQAGAKSYLLKDSAKEDIMQAILSVQAGGEMLPPGIAHRLAEREQRADLTARELDVLHQLGRGRSNSEIAADLGISEETVKTHVKAVFQKLGVNDRTAAVIHAIRHGIIHMD